DSCPLHAVRHGGRFDRCGFPVPRRAGAGIEGAGGDAPADAAGHGAFHASSLGDHGRPVRAAARPGGRFRVAGPDDAAGAAGADRQCRGIRAVPGATGPDLWHRLHAAARHGGRYRRKRLRQRSPDVG
ncbi:hypothetical protein COLO4_00274, partial [Corchorus olitorius]